MDSILNGDQTVEIEIVAGFRNIKVRGQLFISIRLLSLSFNLVLKKSDEEHVKQKKNTRNPPAVSIWYPLNFRPKATA